MLVPCKMFPVIIGQLKYFLGNLGFKDILIDFLVNDNQSCLEIYHKNYVKCGVAKINMKDQGLDS